MTEALPLIAFTLSPLLLTSLIVLFTPITLKNFQAFYLLAGAGWVALHLYFLTYVEVWEPIVILIIGEIVQFVLVGLFGTKLGSANYSSILIGIGLFPWYLGLGVSVLYLLFFVSITTIWSMIKTRIAKKEFDVTGKLPSIKKELSKEDFDKFSVKASTKLAGPIMIAALTAVMLSTLS